MAEPAPAMDGFSYRDGVLHAEDSALSDLAAQYGTPLYVYSAGAMQARCHRLQQALGSALGHERVRVAYAVKANDNQAVIALFARAGCGADVVSGGELQRALAAGIPAERIVFAGVGKQPDEIDAALAAGIQQINVESGSELDLVAARARELGTRAPVAFRVNPNVDARTHAKIATGKAETKFGIEAERIPALAHAAAHAPELRVTGLSVHIGSQLTQLAPFRDAFLAVADLASQLRHEGVPVEHLDLGGGLGAVYTDEAPPAPEDLARVMAETVGRLDCRFTVEPGRWLTAEAGALLTRVLYVKQGRSRTFAVCDGAMNDLLRPSHYDARHTINPVAPAQAAGTQPYDVVGPVCETGDVFASQRSLPELNAGDLLAVAGAGAYGRVMASAYNTRPPAGEALIAGSEAALVRPRPSVAELIAADHVPGWLTAG